MKKENLPEGWDDWLWFAFTIGILSLLVAVNVKVWEWALR